MAFPYDWQKHVTQAVKDLKPHVKEFDVIACQGLSGIMVAVPLAHALKKPCCVVRKTNDYGGGCADTNWCYTAQGNRRVKPPRVLYVDDWIAQGGTRRRVGTAVHQLGGVMTLQYLYDQDRFGKTASKKQGYSEISDTVVKSFGKKANF